MKHTMTPALILLGWLGSGCKSLDDYRILQRENQNLQAQTRRLEDELLATRGATDSLNTQAGSAEQEARRLREVAGNLQAENDMLAQKLRLAEDTLKKMGERMEVGDIAIVGPKLPEPLDSALKTFARNYPDEVDYDPQNGLVKWKSDLLFDLGSDVVKEAPKNSLKRFVQVIQSPAARDFEVIVAGHTDITPIKRPDTLTRHPTNWHLSAHRALAVANVLIDNGYDPRRVGIMGYGEYRPIQSNATPEGKGKNRRVEIYLVPRGAVVQAPQVSIQRPLAHSSRLAMRTP